MSTNGFRGSDNKSTIREHWDLPIIEHWSNQLGRQLDYFGLTGPNIEDIKAWDGVLRHISAVERLRRDVSEREEDLNIHHDLMNNVFKSKVSGKFTLLRGLIEDIVIDGASADGRVPPKSKGSSKTDISFCYDLVNLDFLGGLGYIDKDGAKRVRALCQLPLRQRGTDFLLFLTLNVRDTIRKEMVEFLDQQRENITDGRMRDALEWYASCGSGKKSYLLKAIVPLFMREQAEHSFFTCYCYPPVVYNGTENARMVHFAFEMRSVQTTFRAFSKQKVGEVINLPLLIACDGKLQVLPEQHPNIDLKLCAKQVADLPDGVRSAVERHLPQRAQTGSAKGRKKE